MIPHFSIRATKTVSKLAYSLYLDYTINYGPRKLFAYLLMARALFPVENDLQVSRRDKRKNMTAIMKFEGKFSFIIYSEDFLHTYPHKYAYNSKTINAIKIISSDSDSTINSRLKKHVFRKMISYQIFFNFWVLCPLKYSRRLISLVTVLTVSRTSLENLSPLSRWSPKCFGRSSRETGTS